ncbi:MAG TPA: phosphoglycerate kinase [Gemmatimonadaceae bacterium]|nr:phosphoglycerate kinase [Gemmatimonadaceae bacterium]
MATKTIRDLADSEIRGKRALVRVDFNVPLDAEGNVTDDTRIRASLPTIDALFERGARVVVLLSHLGRPKGKPDPAYSLAPVARRLVELSSHPVIFVPSTVSDDALTATRTAPEGTIVLLENTRYFPGEEKNDADLSRDLAKLGDFYVNDAFGSAHRAHASTEGVAHHLHPAVAGLLMESELSYLGGALESPERPFVAILGGAKISGKIDVINNLLPKVDRLLIGGAMACTFFRAMDLETGGSLVEEDRVELAGKILADAGEKLVLPSDVVVAPSMDAGHRAHAAARDAIPANEAVFDIGPESSKAFAKIIESAKTVVWNGPMGVFEHPPFDAGTRAVGEAMARATDAGATTIVGGGDSAAAMEEMGLARRVSHVSTGGGASLEFLEGKTLPGVAALDQRSGR